MNGWKRRISCKLPLVSMLPVVLAVSLALLLAQPASSEERAVGGSTSSDASNPSQSPGSSDEYKTIAIGTTDNLALDFTPGPNPHIGNQGVISTSPGNTPKEIRVNPLKKGSSSLDIYYENGKLAKRIIYTVITNELSGKVLTIRRLLQDIEGITIESVDDKILIDGELVIPRDLDRILQVQEAYKDVVFNLVTLSKISREAIAKRMQKEINEDPGGVNVTVRIINDTFFLFGKVDNKADMDRAETIAQTYLPEIMGSSAIRENVLTPGTKKLSLRNMIVVEEPPSPAMPKMVRITYHFVEIGKEYLKSSFFKWVPFLSEGAGIQIGPSTTGGVAASSNGTFTGTISNLLPKLQSGANGGFARMLFSTVQLTMDKEETELYREEEIPFVGAVVNGVPITEAQPAGINVKALPTILGDQKVELATYVKFSTIVGNAAGGRPRKVSSSTKNRLILKSGESAAIAGLIDNRTSKSVDKDPETGGTVQGNPIFTLLRSKAFSASKSQFVVFITPKIVEDASEGTADIKAKILNNSTKKRRRIVN